MRVALYYLQALFRKGNRGHTYSAIYCCVLASYTNFLARWLLWSCFHHEFTSPLLWTSSRTGWNIIKNIRIKIEPSCSLQDQWVWHWSAGLILNKETTKVLFNHLMLHHIMDWLQCPHCVHIRIITCLCTWMRTCHRWWNLITYILDSWIRSGTNTHQLHHFWNFIPHQIERDRLST